MSRKRRQYNDDFRASAVLMLEAAGYPEKDGVMTAVSKKLGVPRTTLRRWFTGSNNPPPPELVQEKKRDLLRDLTELLFLHIDEATKTIKDAEHNHIMTGIGILFDKLQLLSGKPTWRVEIVSLLQDGTLKPDDVKSELGEELAAELFQEAGIDIAAE